MERFQVYMVALKEVSVILSWSYLRVMDFGGSIVGDLIYVTVCLEFICSFMGKHLLPIVYFSSKDTFYLIYS